MYLKSIEMINYRKFEASENKIEFVDNISRREGLNIAEKSTLIVGKNNSGKTSVITALDKLINRGEFGISDFNIAFLKKIIIDHIKNGTDISSGLNFSFNICIGLDGDITNDVFTNLVELLPLDDNIKEINFVIKVEYKETAKIINIISDLVLEYSVEKIFADDMPTDSFNELFLEFCNYASRERLVINYYDSKNCKVNNFHISKLIEIKCISANNLKEDKSLSKAFNKILLYKMKELKASRDIDGKLKELNRVMDKFLDDSYAKILKGNVSEILTSDKVSVDISSNIKIENLLGGLIKYSYLDDDNIIPEDQFGLGYTNIMMIVAEIIDYLEKYPDTAFNSKINILSIEEPETFMHPQLQEHFINKIEEGIKELLGADKNINTQLILTSHSSHILNSKIHSGDTFNNIIYMNYTGNSPIIKNLKDDMIVSKLNDIKHDDYNLNNLETLKFIKKHISYRASNLFFSDAVIFVEGDAEEQIIPFYLQKDDVLKSKLITIISIDGKHMQVYLKLIEILKIPCLAICDIDVKREKLEKEEFHQIKSLSGRKSSNYMISNYNIGGTDLTEIKLESKVENLHIVTQDKVINQYYATSLEEAIILTNYDNKILQISLESTIPIIYKNCVGTDNDKNKLKEKSYELQIKLKNKKTEFINELLYNMINCNDPKLLPDLPKYIVDGLKQFRKLF